MNIVFEFFVLIVWYVNVMLLFFRVILVLGWDKMYGFRKFLFVKIYKYIIINYLKF